MVDSRKSLEDELLVLQTAFSSCQQNGDMGGMARARAKIKKTQALLKQLTDGDAAGEVAPEQVISLEAQSQPDEVVGLEEVATPQIQPASPPTPPVEALSTPISEAAVPSPISSVKQAPLPLRKNISSDAKVSPQPATPTKGSPAAATSLASLLVNSLENTPVYNNEEPAAEDEAKQAYADENYLALMGQKLTALTALEEKEREVQAQSLINELIELAQLERSAGVTSVSDSQSLRRVLQQFSEGLPQESDSGDVGLDEIIAPPLAEEVVPVWHEPPIACPAEPQSPTGDSTTENRLSGSQKRQVAASGEVTDLQLQSTQIGAADAGVVNVNAKSSPIKPTAKKPDAKDQIISPSVKEQAAKVLVDFIAGKETLAQIARDEERGSGDEVALSMPNGSDKDLKKEFGKFFKFLTSPQKFISAIEEEQKKSNE